MNKLGIADELPNVGALVPIAGGANKGGANAGALEAEATVPKRDVPLVAAGAGKPGAVPVWKHEPRVKR